MLTVRNSEVTVRFEHSCFYCYHRNIQPLTIAGLCHRLIQSNRSNYISLLDFNMQDLILNIDNKEILNEVSSVAMH